MVDVSSGDEAVVVEEEEVVRIYPGTSTKLVFEKEPTLLKDEVAEIAVEPPVD